MASKRKALSKRTRFEVFKRDKFQCQYCGRTPPTVTLEIDHLLAIANGGNDEESNLLTACCDCNRGKSDRKIGDAPPPLVAQMEIQQERTEQIEAYNQFLLEARQKRELIVAQLGWCWFDRFKEEKGCWVFGDTRAQSVRNFLKHLPPVEIIEAMDIAFARKPVFDEHDEPTFRYFCGVCWRKIRRRNGEED